MRNDKLCQLIQNFKLISIHSVFKENLKKLTKRRTPSLHPIEQWGMLWESVCTLTAFLVSLSWSWGIFSSTAAMTALASWTACGMSPDWSNLFNWLWFPVVNWRARSNSFSVFIWSCSTWYSIGSKVSNGRISIKNPSKEMSAKFLITFVRFWEKLARNRTFSEKRLKLPCFSQPSRLRWWPHILQKH